MFLKKTKLTQHMSPDKQEELSWVKVIFPITRHAYGIYIKIAIILLLVAFSNIFPQFFEERDTISLTLTALFYYLGINILFNYMSAFVVKIYLKKNKYSLDYYDNFIVGVRRISIFIGHLVFLLVLLELLGVQLIEILTAMSLVAVALVLIFKEYISNFLNSITIMFSNNIKINEYVKFGDVKGRIKDISFMNVEIHNDTGEIVYIPTSVILSKELINYSKKKTKRITIEFTIPYMSSKKLDKLEEKVKEKLADESKSIQPDNINLNISKIQKDTIDLFIDVDTKSYNNELESQIRKNAQKIIIDYTNKK